MRKVAFIVISLLTATAFAGTLGPPEEPGKPECRAEKDKLINTAKTIIEDLEQKNALLEQKVAALEKEISSLKSKSSGAK